MQEPNTSSTVFISSYYPASLHAAAWELAKVWRFLPEADEGDPHVERGLVQPVNYVVNVPHFEQITVAVGLVVQSSVDQQSSESAAADVPLSVAARLHANRLALVCFKVSISFLENS
jgi:hypothetical protein